MNFSRRRSTQFVRVSTLLILGLGFAGACAFDTSLREYLDSRFWLPFSKHIDDFAHKNVSRVFTPFSGMSETHDTSPLSRLRTAYQEISAPMNAKFEEAPLRKAVADARAEKSLTPAEREEVSLIDAKIDMRLGQADNREPLERAKAKLSAFLRTARTPGFMSEARGWLARVHFLLGE
jgi:hypothetical protein